MPELLSTQRFSMRLLALSLVCAAGSAVALTPAAQGAPDTRDAPAAQPPSPAPAAASAPKPKLDLSGSKRVGKASFYARKFAGRKMADGSPMDPRRDNAASKTLPLGTTAKVTNLETGQSAVVTIQDRGPYVKGRIVDLSPSTAQQIGLSREEGVTKVEVAPIAVPLPNGSVKLGEAAPDAARPHSE